MTDVLTRRQFLRRGVAIGVAACAAPYVTRSYWSQFVGWLGRAMRNILASWEPPQTGYIFSLDLPIEMVTTNRWVLEEMDAQSGLVMHD